MAPIFTVLLSLIGFIGGILLVMTLIDSDHNDEPKDENEDNDVDGGFYDDYRLP